MITDSDKIILETVGDIRSQLNILGWVPYVPEMRNPRVYIFKSNPDISLQLDEDREIDSVYINYHYVKCLSIVELVRIMNEYDIR